MTYVNKSVVISRAVTMLRSIETYLCIGRLQRKVDRCAHANMFGLSFFDTVRALTGPQGP